MTIEQRLKKLEEQVEFLHEVLLTKVSNSKYEDEIPWIISELKRIEALSYIED